MIFCYISDCAALICHPEGFPTGTAGRWHLSRRFFFCKTAKTGALLKSTSGWDDGGNGFDTYGFAALPAGYHYCDNFSKYGYYAAFWTASELNSKCAFYRYFCTDASIDLEYGGKNIQYSVRLVRDS